MIASYFCSFHCSGHSDQFQLDSRLLVGSLDFVNIEKQTQNVEGKINKLAERKRARDVGKFVAAQNGRKVKEKTQLELTLSGNYRLEKLSTSQLLLRFNAQRLFRKTHLNNCRLSAYRFFDSNKSHGRATERQSSFHRSHHEMNTRTQIRNKLIKVS